MFDYTQMLDVFSIQKDRLLRFATYLGINSVT